MLQKSSHRKRSACPAHTALLALAALVFAIGMAALPQTALAAQEMQDGMKLTIDTERSEYVAGDTVKGSATIENTNSFAVEDVSLTVDLPADMSFTVTPAEATAASLAAGDTLVVDFEAEIPADKLPTDKGEPKDEGSKLPKTGDGLPVALTAVSVVLAAAAVGIVAYRRKVKLGDMAALVLVAALAMPMAAGALPGVPAAHAEPASLQATHVIKVLEYDKDLKATAAYTIPAPVPTAQTVSFLKTDSSTGLGLAGAEFELTSDDDGSVLVASSGADGTVTFISVPIGSYTLVESQVPSGYSCEALTYPVVVTPTGVTIDGAPMAGFSVENTPIPVPQQTPDPTINTVQVGTFMISGSGEPHADLTLIWPNGTTTPLTVPESGLWMSFVPPMEDPLVAYTEIKAHQVLPPMTQSNTVSTTVQPST